MNDTVTVEDAIIKGHRMINYPVLLIMFGTMGLCFYLGIQKIMPGWIIPIGFGLAFGLAWLYWSFMITKWRLWAFENVRNVHELKKRAIQEKLIWSDDSIFGKTEIRRPNDKKRLDSLQSKFNQKDVFFDDTTVPAETIIYYSKSKNFLELAIMLFISGVGFYLVVKKGSYILGSILSIIGVYLSLKEYREAMNIEPQIILNNDGIQTISTDFCDWKDIENEGVAREGSGKYVHYYLVYSFPDGQEKLLIDEYGISQNALNKLLTLYRGRSKKRKNYSK